MADFQSVRTVSHSYPPEELTAMTRFYGGKRCVIQRVLEQTVQWSHIMDAALVPSNARLSQMLARKLRQNRHPQHTAEVRENIVPLKSDHHVAMDGHPPRATLFLHEDILARTLDYEEDLRDWRIGELSAGRSDPGRPEYDEVFGGISVTLHRYHVGNGLAPFFRNMSSSEEESFWPYHPHDCPGIDNPESHNHFPIIDTLLSIPFSLLHTLPRLTGIVPLSDYQRKLITIGLEITHLWWWDPSPQMIRASEAIRDRNVAANQLDDGRKPKPHPIAHSSRNGVTFQTKQPVITFGPVGVPPSSSGHCVSPNWDPCITESSGQILLGTTSSLLRDKDELLVLTNDDDGGEKHDVHGVDKCLVNDHAAGSLVTSGTWDVQTPEGFTNSDSIDEDFAVIEEPTIHRSSSDIISWYEEDVDARATVAPSPLPSTPFEKGIIGGLTTNDDLMIKGLIDPRVYLQFLDLKSFSCP